MRIVVEEETPIEVYGYVRIYGYADISEEFREIISKLRETFPSLADVLAEFYEKEWDFDGKIRFRNEYCLANDKVYLSVEDIGKKEFLFLEYVKENYPDLVEKYGEDVLAEFYSIFQNMLDMLYDSLSREIRIFVRNVERKYL